MATEITEENGIVTNHASAGTTIETEFDLISDELYEIQVRVNRFLLKLDKLTAKVEAEYARRN